MIGLFILLILVVGGYFLSQSPKTSDSTTGAYVSEESVRVSKDGLMKTYRNPQVGFSFEYPATLYLQVPSFPETYFQDESLSDEQREEKFQKDQEAWRNLLTKINNGVTRGEGSNYREIDVTVMDPADLPTRAEERAHCEDLKKMNPKLPPEEACVVSSPTQEDLAEEQALIASGVIGERTPAFSKTLLGGVIVKTDEVRGIRDLALSSDTGDYVAMFSTYTSDGKRITLTMWLPQDARPDVISPNDAQWLQKAVSDPRNSGFDRAVFSFKLL